jgi:mannose/fructose/N-acetylgalactosamine-specific phosphotransferase system component IIC
MDGPAQYLQWGFIQISLANLVVIGLMIVVFALAVIARRREKNRVSTLEANPPVTEQPAKKGEVEV